MSSSTVLFAEMCFRVAFEVYVGKILITAIPDRVKNNDTVCRDVIKEILSHVPMGLVDDDNSRGLTRALWSIILPGDSNRCMQYTKHELALALTSVITGAMSRAKASRTFGVPTKTLKKKHKRVHSMFGIESGRKGMKEMKEKCIQQADDVFKAIRCIVESNSGQYSPFINDDQGDLLNRVGYLSGRTGTVMDTASIGAMAKTAIKASGEFDLLHAGDDQRKVYKAMQKINATGSKKFVRNRVSKGTRLSEENKSGMRKVQKLADKRARAMCPVLELAARRKYVEGVENLIQKKRITAEQFLDPKRHSGMDEVAQSTNNRHGRVLAYGIDGDYFDQTISCEHERSKFHTSLCLTSGAVGKMTHEMTVIHSQKSETMVSRDVYNGLSPDILVDTSPSAYNTQDIFLKIIKDFQKKTNAGKGNPQFYWMDNHWSHGGGNALKCVAIYFFPVQPLSNFLPFGISSSIPTPPFLHSI